MMVGCCGWSTVTYIHQLPVIVEEYTPSISCMLVVHVLPFHTKSMLLPHQRD